MKYLAIGHISVPALTSESWYSSSQYSSIAALLPITASQYLPITALQHCSVNTYRGIAESLPSSIVPSFFYAAHLIITPTTGIASALRLYTQRRMKSYTTTPTRGITTALSLHSAANKAAGDHILSQCLHEILCS